MKILKSTSACRKLSKSRRFRKSVFKTILRMLKLSSLIQSGESATTSRSLWEAKELRILLPPRLTLKERFLMAMLTVTMSLINRPRPRLSRAFQWKSFPNWWSLNLSCKTASCLSGWKKSTSWMLWCFLRVKSSTMWRTCAGWCLTRAWKKVTNYYFFQISIEVDKTRT